MLPKWVDLWEAALFYSFMRLGYPKTNPGLSEGRKLRLKHRDTMGMQRGRGVGGGGDAWWVKRIYANIDPPQGKISAVPGQISKGALGGLQLKPRNGW